MADNPKAGCRAISGLVLAVFVGTCAFGVITTIVAYSGGTAGASADSTGTLVAQLVFGPRAASGPRSIPAATTKQLSAIPGVTGIATIRDSRSSTPVSTRVGGRTKTNLFPTQVIACADLAGVPALGHCRIGAEVAEISPDFGGSITDRLSMPNDDLARGHLVDCAVGTSSGRCRGGRH